MAFHPIAELSPEQSDGLTRDLDELGYAVVENALDAATLDALRDRLENQMKGEEKKGVTFSDIGSNRRIFNLVNKGRIFENLILHPAGLAAARHLLGEDFILSSITANVVQSPGEAQYHHRDQLDDFRSVVVVQMMWTLDDFTKENGATRVIRGSHRWGPDISAFSQDQLEALAVPVEAPAGSVIIFGGMMVHSAGANQTDRPRRGILTYFSKPYYRQSENYALSLSPEVYERASPELLDLLGFRSHASFGWVDGPPAATGEFLRGSGRTARLSDYSAPLDADGRPMADA